MKIGIRLTVALAVPIAVLIALFGLLEEHANRARFHRELAREGHVIARTVQIAMQYALRDRQIGDIQKLIDEITGYERVLGIRLLGPDGGLRYQSSSLGQYPTLSADTLRSVLTRGAMLETHTVVEGQPVLALLAPLFSDSGAPLGAVEVFQLESFVQEDASASRAAIALLTGVMIVAVALVLFLVTRANVARPIEDLVRSFREVGSGRLSSRVPVRRSDELGRLADEYNAMCERLDRTQRSLLEEQEERRRVEASLHEAERLASIGRFSAGLAHEIGTPLNVISGRAELLLRRGAGGEAGEKNLRIIAAQIDRISRIVRSMLDFARVRALRLTPTSLPELVTRVCELVEHRLQQSGIVLDTHFAAELPEIPADPDQLHEVFLNMILNAADAMPRGGRLSIETGLAARPHPERGGPAERFATVIFQDTGQGIAPEDLDRVFDPFFTTKDVGEGTGLGLSVSYGIVREHGGWIEIASAVGHGTRVTLYLPLERAAAGEPAAAAVAAREAGSLAAAEAS